MLMGAAVAGVLSACAARTPLCRYISTAVPGPAHGVLPSCDAVPADPPARQPAALTLCGEAVFHVTCLH